MRPEQPAEGIRSHDPGPKFLARPTSRRVRGHRARRGRLRPRRAGGRFLHAPDAGRNRRRFQRNRLRSIRGSRQHRGRGRDHGRDGNRRERRQPSVSRGEARGEGSAPGAARRRAAEGGSRPDLRDSRPGPLDLRARKERGRAGRRIGARSRRRRGRIEGRRGEPRPRRHPALESSDQGSLRRRRRLEAREPGRVLEGGGRDHRPGPDLRAEGHLLGSRAVLGKLKAGAPVSVSTTAYPGYALSGRIDVIDPVLDPETRSARVTARVRNPGGKFRPGMSANASVVLSERMNALTIPNEAVFAEGNQTLVYVVQADSTVSRRAVTLGTRLSDEVEVVQGLEPGQRVVVAGHQKLFETAKVIPIQSQGGGGAGGAGGGAPGGAAAGGANAGKGAAPGKSPAAKPGEKSGK
ncbi:MAG: efflux RND transporter periplasmic adaptor subunit [Candidatus Eisenbacteria bacterium]|uniref:Efflux RND transporter periplasmic adaptor subunit n=1 Tax=Eiseniibacteriota bacterium TaxID=2212470 RepID=A0A538TTC8_UNCEI|nr:MAG: efflux RND transporter periplasmic adaptor subunit [Candidatus Eisenbacteria bacterium]